MSNSDPIAEAAKRDLTRLSRQGETLGGTAMHQASSGLAKPDDEDAIDRLGKRIGRGLAIASVPLLLWYFGSTAGWW